MKKILLAFLLIAGFLISGNVQAQTKTKYYFYPSENIYYNTASGQYAYLGSDNQWTWGTLPSAVGIADTANYIALYSPNNDIWKQNSIHKMKYKNGKLKKVKTKPADK